MRLGKQAIVWARRSCSATRISSTRRILRWHRCRDSRVAHRAVGGARDLVVLQLRKIEDVRLELAVNLDDFEPADLGRCGEPFAVELVCGITFGYFAHGFLGRGSRRPGQAAAPWEDASGIEAGARLEWRYGASASSSPTSTATTTSVPAPDLDLRAQRRSGHRTPATRGPSRPCTSGAEPACLGVANGVLVDAAGDPIRYADSDEDGVPDTLYERAIRSGRPAIS